jgi:hypothetical protein
VLRPDLAQNTPIQTVYRELAHDEARNRLILNDVIRAIEEGRSPILLTERKDHLEYFADHVQSFVRHVVVLQGRMTKKERMTRVQRLESTPDTEERLLLATGRYIGEGFDDARLDTLFLALPVAWKGTLVQYAGRLHRLHPRKTEVRIFDYVDRGVPTLLRMFEKRLRGYRAIGYARGEAPLGYTEPSESRIVEYDDDILRSLDRDEDLAWLERPRPTESGPTATATRRDGAARPNGTRKQKAHGPACGGLHACTQGFGLGVARRRLDGGSLRGSVTFRSLERDVTMPLSSALSAGFIPSTRTRFAISSRG